MSNKSFVEDLLTLGTGVLSNLADARHELKSQAKNRTSSVARSLDLVTREEFDAAFAMLAKARNAQEELTARLDKIEKHLNLSAPKKKVKTKTLNLPSVKLRAKPHSKK